jgi:outer membrane protein OmpA-like peptidoglycan-associated protein
MFADSIQEQRTASIARMQLAAAGTVVAPGSEVGVTQETVTESNGAQVTIERKGQLVDNEFVADLGSVTVLKLADNTELQVGEQSVEKKLVDFIQHGTIDEANKSANWISFDRLQFESGKTTLKPSSEEQLKNVAAILKAYPDVSLKIGGYTDNTGDAAGNLKLSKERAVNVMNRLVTMGIDASRLEADGYGQEFPVGDNNTDLGKAMNRRIDVKVSKK